MAKQDIKRALMRAIPDLPLFRRAVSKLRIALEKRYVLPENDVAAGEKDWETKKRLIADCKRKWPKAAVQASRLIDATIDAVPVYKQAKQTEDTNYLDRVRLDMFFCYFAYGFTADEYFTFRLENKGIQDRKSFISERLRIIFRCRMNDMLQADIFKDKTKTYAHYKELYHREAISVSKPEHFEQYQKFVKRHPVYVKKAAFEAQGRSVELIDSTDGGQTERNFFDSLIAQGKHILEERIIQTPELAAFNKSSVNTVRAITFNTRNGIIVPYCTIRTGRPGSFVDNGGAGGVQACIDFSSGKIITNGFDELGGEFTAHPASNTVFKGYQLPDWELLQGLVKKAASQMPLIKFIGWDLAHTKDGWIIVEGNESPYVIAQQMIKDHGMREVFESIMQDMDLVV